MQPVMTELIHIHDGIADVDFEQDASFVSQTILNIGDGARVAAVIDDDSAIAWIV